ncbi:coiled-coil alpha-helical rod protein 1 [Neosynchiropus ocellatus]
MWEAEWRLKAEAHKAEAERFKGQVEALKETAEQYRKEIQERDATLNKQSRDLEVMREELFKAKTEYRQMREELTQTSSQKDKISSQLERLKRESGEELEKLRRDLQTSREEVREVSQQGEHRAATSVLHLSKQLQEIQKKHEVESEQLRTSHCAEMTAARESNCELQNQLQSLSKEVPELKRILADVSAEREGLKGKLSEMEVAFKSQSETLHSLRNYIGQLVPERGEAEQLHDAVKRLSKEKALLEKTTELLTVRLNSVSEILDLQEEKMLKTVPADPLAKNGSERIHLLRLWREKVFKLCIQLRSKDIELRGEKNQLLTQIQCAEQNLQQERLRVSVLQHSQDARLAELDQEKMEKESLEQILSETRRENSQLKARIHTFKDELRAVKEAVQAFSQAFEGKLAEVDSAQAELGNLTQRLSFANRRVETVQGLIMRRVALQSVQQAGHQAELEASSFRKLRSELTLVCEERDKLTQELKRTPELIENALAGMKEKYEGQLRQQQGELEESRTGVREATAAHEEDRRRLQLLQTQLEMSKLDLEKLHSELISQQEASERALQEKVSEIESRCADKLSWMEDQLRVAQREHTRAVMALRRFERDAARARTHTAIRDKQTVDTRSDPHEQVDTFTRNVVQDGPEPQLHGRPSVRRGAPVSSEERLLCVLEELQTLSAAVVNSSEEEEEEDEEDDSTGTSTHS